MLHFSPTLALKHLVPLSPTLYLLPLHPHHRLMLLAVSLYLLLPLLLPDSFRVLQMECYTFFRLISLTLFVSRNLILTYLSLSGSLDSLLCDLIAPTSSLVFFSTDFIHASSVIIFVRQGLSFSEFFTSSLSSLDPYSGYVGVNIYLNNSSSLSFLNVYALPIRSSPTNSRTNLFSPAILPSSRNLFILEDFNCHHFL